MGVSQSYIYQSNLGAISWRRINKHIHVGRDDGRIDESQEEKPANEGTDGMILRIWVFSFGQASNLLANPTDTVGRLLETFNDGGEECVRNIRQHGETWLDDSLDRFILRCLLGRYRSW